MKLAVSELGLKLEEFWEMTLYEIKLLSQAKNEQNKKEIERDKWIIWHQEALRRQKKLMPLKKFIEGEEHKTKILKGKEAEEKRKEFEEMKKLFNR